MMTSWNGNIFRVTGLFCGEVPGPRWIPRTKASDAELWCFLWSTIIGPFFHKYHWNPSTTMFTPKNDFENIVCKIAAIFLDRNVLMCIIRMLYRKHFDIPNDTLLCHAFYFSGTYSILYIGMHILSITWKTTRYDYLYIDPSMIKQGKTE